MISGSLSGGLSCRTGSSKWLSWKATSTGTKNLRLPTFTRRSRGSLQGAVSLDGEYEKIERVPEYTGAEGILDLETLRAPLVASLFQSPGLNLRAAATFVRQKGRFSAFPGLPIVSKDDQGLIVDIQQSTCSRDAGAESLWGSTVLTSCGFAGDSSSQSACCH